MIKKLNKNPSDKNDVIQSEKKLQDLVFVYFLENFNEEQKYKITNSKVQYYIPWRPVWNTDSVCTRCRLVFNATHSCNGEYSLNSLLDKGRNSMNKLVEVMIRWLTQVYAFHTDISKMYNSVKLREDDWCYQLYLWDEFSLDNDNHLTKVMKTTIYGNQAERGIRETGRLCATECPRASEVIHRDTYLDDCLSGEHTWEVLMSNNW